MSHRNENSNPISLISHTDFLFLDINSNFTLEPGSAKTFRVVITDTTPASENVTMVSTEFNGGGTDVSSPANSVLYYSNTSVITGFNSIVTDDTTNLKM